MRIEVVESVSKTIGSLALAYPYLRRLGVAEAVDGRTTTGKQREVSTGHVIEVLILNRLTLRPSPISKIDGWAKGQAIEEVYGVAAEALNDDRIGRALDELHPHLADVWAAIVLAGTQAYAVGLEQVHSDVTRLAFEGAYEEVPTEMDGRPLPRITYGYTGKQAPSRKQLTLPLSMAADGAIPLWYHVADGNAADARCYLAHLAALRERLHLDEPLVVGDSKLITRPNMRGFCRARARFIGPCTLTAADRRVLRHLWEGGAPLERMDAPPPGQAPTAGRYWALECAETLVDAERGTAYPLRRLFVQSLTDRAAVRHQRAKDLARARRDLWAITGRLGTPAYRQRARVERNVAAAVARVGRYLRAEVREADGRCSVHWRLDHARLREDAVFDGIYCLLTNCTAAQRDTRAVFRAYKGESAIEGRFRAVKQPPIQVRPLWLHQPRRIESLVFVAMVALFLFALIEREARRVVQASGRFFTGLRPEGRDKLPVTAARLFEVFAPLSLIKQRLPVDGTVTDVLTPATLSPIQAQILDRLGLIRPESYLHPAITPHPS